MRYFHEIHRFLFTITVDVYCVPYHIKDNLLYDDPIVSKSIGLSLYDWMFDHNKYVRDKTLIRMNLKQWAVTKQAELELQDFEFKRGLKNGYRN